MGGGKIERDMARAELPGLLRRLADALEGAGEVDAGLQALAREPWRKLVLVAASEDEGLRVKLKAKAESRIRRKAAADAAKRPDADAAKRPAVDAVKRPAVDAAKRPAVDAAGRDKYRRLKKALQADFKVLLSAARQGVAPPAEALDSFLALAEIMAADESPISGQAERAELARANAAFFEACRDLRRAAAARDASAVAEVLQGLDRRKAACHAQFK